MQKEMARLEEIAKGFIEIIKKYHPDWDKYLLTDAEKQVLVDIASAAGFKTDTISQGQLCTYCREENNSLSGRNVLVNSFWPIYTRNQSGLLDYVATGWLNFLARFTSEHLQYNDLIEKIVEQIEISIPLEPIVLTSDGDKIREIPRDFCHDIVYPVFHARDNHELPNSPTGIGIHSICCGDIIFSNNANTYVLECQRCRLRVEFLTNGNGPIKTYGDLRHALLPLLNKT